MTLEKIEYRRMAFVRHFAQVAMATALDEHKLCIGHFFRQHLAESTWLPVPPS